MKLNNKGWGLSTMIVLMSILIFFLLLTTIMVYSLYRYRDSKINNEENIPKNYSNPVKIVIY